MARKGVTRVLGVGLLGLLSVAGGACGGGPAVEDSQGSALAANALAANALAANALAANALAANALRDPLARQFLKYVVSCALPADKSVSISVDGQSYTYPGLLGMAPQWGEDGGSCDEECQRWVSGCVLARVDFLGVERMISLRGANKGLRTSEHEAHQYPVREATYFGNLFVPGQPRYLCLSPGQKQDERVCGDSLANCPMEVVGSCAQACAHEGAHDAFVDCSSSGRARRPENYHESVTVFLPKQDM
jgi:hypothetical protein